jgi:glycosyltransferase involved in cell wall biosynthesis
MDTNMTNPSEKNPTISIITPTYNRAAYIGRAIESVFAQSYSDWELLIIDDGSTDTTESIVRSFIEKDSARHSLPRIFYFKNEKNLGIAETRNAGLVRARGTYIAMLDSDDVWLDPEKLTKQIAAFEKDTPHNESRPLGIVGTWIVCIDEQGKTMRNISFSETDTDIRQSLLYRNHIAQSSVLFLKKAAIDAGSYDTTFSTMDDHDLWLHIGTKYRIATLPFYTTGYRIHSEGITKTRKVLAAQEEISIMHRWKKSYPGFGRGMIKGYLRLLRAYL